MSRANEYRKRRAQADEPTTELTLPSGAIFTCRRPPLQVWIAAGKIPQSFLAKMRRVEGAEIDPVQVGDDETLAAVAFVRDAIIYACVSPKLVRGGAGDDELDPSELDPEDFEFLTRWIMSGCPGVPVKTRGGEASIDDLSRFRQKRTGGEPFSLEPDGDEIQLPPVSAIGAA